MEIVKYSTHYLIKQPGIRMLDLMDKLSTIEFNTEEKKPLAFMYDKARDELKVPSGVGDEELRKVLKFDGKILHGKPTPFKRVSYEMKSKPLPGAQQKVIGDILNKFKDNTQVFCDLPTGIGKTFVASFLTNKMQLKALVMVLTDNLRQQWMESFLKHTGLKRDQVQVIEGGKAFVNANPNAMVYIATHHSVRSILSGDRSSTVAFNDWLSKHQIGLKIYDEADLETANMFRMDMCSSVIRTLYLTATTKKSSKDDDNVYQYAMNDVPKFGSEHFKGIVADRHAHIIKTNSKPGKLLYNRALSFSGDFSWFKYCDYLFMFRQQMLKGIVTHAIDFWKKIRDSEDKNAKLLITIPKKSYCFILRDLMMEWFGFSIQDIGVYNSMTEKKYKDFEKSKKIIISTIGSMGRGVDVPGLKVYLDLEIYTSEPMFYQATGRVARNGAKGYYISVYDFAYSFISISYHKKSKFFKKIFKSAKIEEKKYELDEFDSRDEIKQHREDFRKKWWRYFKHEQQNNKKGR